MNTGVQRSGATPPAARTATTQAVGAEPGNTFGQGKSAPLIAMAHEIPYVATATVADLHDLEAKVERAMELHGARYLHVLVSCPLGWGTASADSIRIARLATETGLFPVFEAERRRRHRASRRSAGRCPVEDYLRPQRRFAPPLRAGAAPRRHRAHPGARRPQHRPLRAAAMSEQALRDHARRRLEPAPTRPASWRTERPVVRQARRACGGACPAGEDVAGAGSTTPRRATTRRPGGEIMEDNPLPGDHGPRLLPPVRDGVQPRPARRGRRHQLRRALPRRRGDRARLDASSRSRRPLGQARARRRRRPLGPVGRLPPDAGSATRSRSTTPARAPAG